MTLNGRTQRRWLGSAVASLHLLLLLAAACADPDQFATPDLQEPAQPVPTTPATAVAAPVDGIAPTAPVVPPRDWTILYYGTGDSEMTPFLYQDLNEMEAAGSSDRVAVLATADWNGPPEAAGPEAVRYVIGQDNDPLALNASVAAVLGEANFGDPAVLANFIAWGATNYPAERYALFLPGFGGGRAGCCLDRNVGLPDQIDHLSLTDIAQAVAQAQSQTGLDRLDVLAFGGSTMAQVDILPVLQSAADILVASPALVPGEGWEYQSTLGQLYANPSLDAAGFASQLVSDYTNYHRQLLGNEFVSMAAFDLSRVPDLVLATETLAMTIAATPETAYAAAADARRGAQPYAAAAATTAASRTLVDAHHAASILASRGIAPELEGAARALAGAIDGSLIAADHGRGLPNSRGLAIYWPSSATDLEPSYIQAPTLPNWAAFLRDFTAAPLVEAPLTAVFGRDDQSVAAGQPAVLTAEVIGRQLNTLSAVAVQPAGEGRRAVYQAEPLLPPVTPLPGDSTLSLWEDGRHESLVVWDSVTGYLYDAAGAAENTLLRTVDRVGDVALLVAQGDLRRAGAETGLPATLEFPVGNAVPSHAWVGLPVPGGTLIGQIRPAQGDTFNPYRFFEESDGRLTTEPGITLTFDNASAVYRSARSLPEGDYQLGIRATALGGPSSTATLDVSVGGMPVAEGYRTYIDPSAEVQFAYPKDWPAPAEQNGVLFTSDGNNTTTLQVRRFPDYAGDLAALQDEVAAGFGEVSIVFEEPAQVGDPAEPIEAIRTIYGYTSADRGPRVGTFLTFLHNGTGYVIDLDGPQEAEATTVQSLTDVADSWRFLAGDAEVAMTPWTTAGLGLHRIDFPADYVYQEHNGWHRFSLDPQTFLATRTQPAGRSIEEAVSALLQTASQNVSSFSSDQLVPFYLAGKTWGRSDFRYQGAGTTIRGTILARQENGQELAVWAEAPEGKIPDPFSTVYFPMAASLTAQPPAGN